MQYFVLLAALAVLAAASSWTIVDNDYATIAMSCSFQDATSGWVGGGTGSLQPLLLHTTNAGKNFTNAPSDMNDAAFMSIAMADATHGVAGALGFFGLPCGAVTSNGTWSQIHDGRDIICAFQAADAVNQNTFVLTGPWATLGDFNGNGVQISTDGGNTWSIRNWGSSVPARYSSFLSATYGYVSGGSWPSTSLFDSKSRLTKIPFRLTRYLSHNGRFPKYDVDDSVAFDASEASLDGYTAVISRTTDGGKSWTVLVNMTGQGVYFNEIDCVDQNTCWVVGEGVNKTTGEATAWVYATTNGFQTVQTQLSFPSGSLVTVNFVSSTVGWVAGAQLPANSEAQTEGMGFFTTDGGKTWTASNQLRNFYFTQVSTVDANNAFGAGITSIGLSSLAEYK